MNACAQRLEQLLAERQVSCAANPKVATSINAL